MRPTALPARITVALVALLALGAATRLVWPGDMEFKQDEQYVYAQATGPDPWPGLGQPSGAGTRNPGMGIWIFSAFAKVGLDDPVTMVRPVMVLNVLALLALAAFALRIVEPRRREAWLWATALVAVNPLMVLFSRKIWIQSLLPPFVMVAFLGWWYRQHRWGAFTWGLVGAWLGQIHMTGFLFAAGLAGWTALRARTGVRWRWWLAGSFLGALTMIRWIDYILSGGSSPDRSVSDALRLEFFGLWARAPLGLDVVESFGDELDRFVAAPTVGGVDLYLGATCLALAVALGIAIAVEALAEVGWPRFPRRPRPQGEHTTLLWQAGLWGYGILATLTAITIFRHYVLVAFPLPFLIWTLAALMRPRRGRLFLICLVAVEAVMTLLVLGYVHANDGVAGGDYGVSYEAQQRR